jgi:hypothetical protein
MIFIKYVFLESTLTYFFFQFEIQTIVKRRDTAQKQDDTEKKKLKLWNLFILTDSGCCCINCFHRPMEFIKIRTV